MFSAQPARASMRRRSRLVAACTTGVLSLGALALGPVAVAHADTAAPRPGGTVGAHEPAAPRPTLNLPHSKKRALSTSAAALTTPRYDIDGDGHADSLTQEGNGHVLQQSSSQASNSDNGWVDLGTNGTQYKDVLTPGDLDASVSGPEVLTLTTTGHLSLWANGTFPSGGPSWTGSGWQIYNKVIAVGDITGDGHVDLMARDYAGDLWLYKGTGSASSPFAARIKAGFGFGIYDQLVGAGDLTGSGLETLVTRDLDGNLWLYKATGNDAAPLAGRIKIGTGWNVYNQILGIGDEIDKIGGIYGRTLPGDLYFYQGDGTGTGTLTARTFAGSQWNDALIAGQGGSTLWGKNNLFALTSGGNLYYYYGMQTGLLSSRILIPDAGGWQGARLNAPVSLTQADEEPLLQTFQGTLYNDVDGSTVSTGWGSYNLTVGPGDLSGDGNSDILARDTSGVLWNYTGRGNGLLYGRVKVGGGWNGYNAIIGAGDIDGDGRADIVARDASNGHLYIYKGTGVATSPFKARVDIGGGWSGYTKLAAPGDLDGDGRADIVAVNSAGELYRYSGSGHNTTATFKPRVKIGTAGWNGYYSIS